MKNLSLNEWIAVAVGVVVVAYVFLYSSSKMMAVNNLNINEENRIMNESTSTPAQLIINDTLIGSGEVAVPGKNVTVNYTGRLTNGTVFDSSIPRGEPFTFSLGAGQVIAGWEQGVAGMKVGGKRMLTIPPELAYGNRAIGSIPPNSTLIFDVELLAVE